MTDPANPTSVTINSKHPEANSETLEPIIREIAPNISDIHWIESDSEDLILEIDGDDPHPQGSKTPGDPYEKRSSGAHEFQQQVMLRLHE